MATIGSTIIEFSIIRFFHSSINSSSIEILKLLRVSTNSSISFGELTNWNLPFFHWSIIWEQKLPSQNMPEINTFVSKTILIFF